MSHLGHRSIAENICFKANTCLHSTGRTVLSVWEIIHSLFETPGLKAEKPTYTHGQSIFEIPT